MVHQGVRGLYEVCDVPAVEQMIEREVRVTRVRYTDVNLPFVAWDYLRQRLEDRLYTHTGGRRESVLYRHQNTLPRIAKTMNAVYTHGVLRGFGMEGTHTEIFPVWAQERDRFGRIWSPVPNGGRFTVLVPAYVEQSRRVPRLTHWVEAPIQPSHWLADEAVHQLVDVAVRHR